MRKLIMGLLMVGISTVAHAGLISLVYDGNMTPDPNTEVTVYVHSDTSLFAMGVCVVITGDASITSAMCEADCNQYGWDNGWNSDPYIDDVNNWLYLNGVRWASDANGTIGYFKFIYHSGQVTVSFLNEDGWNCAFGWDGDTCWDVPFSTDILTFGVEGQNESMGQSLGEQNTDEIPVISSKLQPTLMYCPADACSGTEQFSKAAYENLKSEKTADDSGGQMMEMDSVITISSNITTNQIWTSGNTYHVIADVNVRALLVIEPGTVVYYGGNGTLRVNNGGTLISCGTPDDPIVYTSDSGYGWDDYECAIHIQQTASPATKVTYSYIDCAFIAIQIDDIRLDTPIENNRLLYNNCGVLEYGTHHTDIVNNLIALGFNEYYYSTAIEVDMESTAGVGDANSNILIQNNTCDYQDYGIVVFGTDEEADAGTVVLANNIVSESAEYGLVPANGYMEAMIANTGYYANTTNKYWEFKEYNPVQATQYPYDAEGWHLIEGCPFINQGLEYIEQTSLIGKTTDINSTPDSNFVDIGFHYPNWSFSNANSGFAASDFNIDTITDYKDLYVLTSHWLSSVTPGSNGDLDNDGNVTFIDYACFASNWQKIQGEPNVAAMFSADVNDVNNIKGSFEVDANNSAFVAGPKFVLMDGQFMGGTTDIGDYPVTIESYKFLNGEHEFKIATIAPDGSVTVSPSQIVTFNNPIYCADINDFFESQSDYRINGFHDGPNSVTVTITNLDNQTIWTNSYSGNSISVSVSAATLSSQKYCTMTIASSPGMTIDLTRKFNPLDYEGQTIQMLIITPDKDVFKVRRPAIEACATACNQRNVTWVPLYLYDVTKENLTNLLTRSSVKYVYWCGHANSHVGRDEKRGIPGVQRTNTICWKRILLLGLPYPEHYEVETGVFSYINPEYPLPNGWDERGFDLRSLNMYNSGHKKVVFVDGCLSAHFDDMARSYGMFSDWNLGHYDQAYIGWKIKVLVSKGIMETIIGNTTEAVRMFWERMGLHDTVFAALYYTYVHGGSNINHALWGLNGLVDIGSGGPDEIDDNIILWGEGLTNQLDP